MATRLGVIGMGCISISTSFVQIVQQVPLSLSIGSTSVIGNLIGENDAKLGKVVAVVTYLHGALFSTLISVFTYVYAAEIASIYTKSPEMLEELEGVFQALSLQIAFVSQVFCL